MDFGPFGLISLFYAVLGVRLLFQLIRNWHDTWDLDFTPADRMLVDQAAFFVLVPIAVALHELGHAVAIWLFGGQVLDFGYYGFAGYVSYDPRLFTDFQMLVIASAGTLVNIGLGAIALGLVFFRRPPMRAAYNELAIQFTFISLLNALVVYPLLDVLTGMEGDWSQMYFSGVPNATPVILAIHVLLLAGLFWIWRSPAIQGRVAVLTANLGARPGGGRATSPRVKAANATMRAAAQRVSSGWAYPVQQQLQVQGDQAMLSFGWTSHDLQRAVILQTNGDGLRMTGFIFHAGAHQSRPLDSWPVLPDVDQLTLDLRRGVERVDGWSIVGGAVGGPASTPGMTRP